MKRFEGHLDIRRWMRSILGRSILFTLSLLLLTLFVAIMVTNSSQNALRREIVVRSGAQADAVAEQLAISLDKTMDMHRELLYDKDINRLGVTPGYYTQAQQTLAMLRVMDRMFMLTSSSPLIQQAFLLAPSIGKTITADGVDDLDPEYFNRLNDLCVHQTQALIEMDGCFYIMMAYPTYNYYLKENGASYMLCLQLDQGAIASFLAAHGSLESGALFLFSDDGRVIASVNRDQAQVDVDTLFSLARKQPSFDFPGEDGERYLVSVAVNTTTTKTLYLVDLRPSSQAFSVLNLQGSFFMALVVLLILANLAYILHMWHVIHKPLNKLAEAFQQVEQGDFSLRIHHTRDDDFSDMYHRFNLMNQRLGNLIEQVYMQTIRTQRAELKQLQSQINPHFLYNNLFTIRSLAQLKDTDTIEVLSAELGEYFRYMTRLGKQEVTLLEEVAHGRNYAMIQDMRFSARIVLSFPELPRNFHAVAVPRLILQPILENAYEHGLRQTAADGRLRISYTREGEDALILVEDSGNTLTDSTIQAMTMSLSGADHLQETTGLINIHRRLRLRFGDGYGLTFGRSDLGGLKVTMRIPMSERSDSHTQNPDC